MQALPDLYASNSACGFSFKIYKRVAQTSSSGLSSYVQVWKAVWNIFFKTDCFHWEHENVSSLLEERKIKRTNQTRHKIILFFCVSETEQPKSTPLGYAYATDKTWTQTQESKKNFQFF